MIRAVVFDFDGTLVDFINSDVSALKRIHQLTGSSVNEDVFVDTAIREIIAFHELVNRDKVDPLQMHKYRLSNTFKQLGIVWNEGYVDHYRAELLRETKPYKGTHDILVYLRDRVLLGLISNAYDAIEQRKRIEVSGLADFFEQVIIAGEVGLAKPDPDIFILMSRKLGVNPAECLFIGDSIKYDISGAKRAGMQTVLINGKGNLITHEPDYKVNDMQQLAGIMEGIIA